MSADQIEQQYINAYVWLYKYWGYEPTLSQVADRLRVHPRTLKRWLSKYQFSWPPHTPTTVTPTMVTPVGQCVIVQGVSWETYICLLADLTDNRGIRLAYDQETLELMAPSFNHEHIADLLSDIVKAVAEAQEQDVVPAGSTTFKRQDVRRGFEPDASFYIHRAATVQGHTVIDLTVDPPPDLIIEMDLSHPSLEKFPIYAALGVPEVWRYDGQRVHIHHRAATTYVPEPVSTVLPGVTGADLTQWIQAGLELARLPWIRQVRTWAASLAEARRE